MPLHIYFDRQHIARSSTWRCGGIYDQLGGGFHRYSVDAQWLVPHFEKMLYDNALLAARYSRPGRPPARPVYAAWSRETLDYVLRDMTHPGGRLLQPPRTPTARATRASSIVWSEEEIRDDSRRRRRPRCSMTVYGVSREGNWEEHNILNRTRNYSQDSRLMHIAEPELREAVSRGAAQAVGSSQPAHLGRAATRRF